MLKTTRRSFNTLALRAGTPIGGNDLWIACYALAENSVLVTNNTTVFERIAGLTLENWVN
jgi:tRNA(fMet)-specific endonuclease VapC